MVMVGIKAERRDDEYKMTVNFRSYMHICTTIIISRKMEKKKSTELRAVLLILFRHFFSLS